MPYVRGLRRPEPGMGLDKPGRAGVPGLLGLPPGDATRCSTVADSGPRQHARVRRAVRTRPRWKRRRQRDMGGQAAAWLETSCARQRPKRTRAVH